MSDDKNLAGGWQGKLLTVDVSSAQMEATSPEPDQYRRCIGGTGLAGELLYDLIPAGADPLGAENAVGVFTGPLTGTRFPGCGRVTVCGLSPLTQGWGQASMGGYLGTALKRADWDGILLNGTAPEPVYVLIEDDEAELVDASDLWGLGTFEAEALLKERHPGSEIACIGPAGETLCPLSGIVHRRTELAARCGLGAVLGSKKVKAIVVRGSGDVKVVRGSAFESLLSRHRKILETHPQARPYSEQGTASLVELSMMLGDMPVRNWSGETWKEGAESLSGAAIVSQILVKRAGCYACPIRCKGIVTVNEGNIDLEESPGPEYETLGSLGTLLRHRNLAGVTAAGDLCDRLGLDTISTGSAIAWAMEAFERGALTTADTDGLELVWGDTDAILEATEAMGRGKGDLGALLRGGSRAASEAVGQGSEAYAMHVKGLDLPMHHPRVFHGLALAYACLPHGASHMEGGFNQRGPRKSLEDWISDTNDSIRDGTLANDVGFCAFTANEAPLQFVADLLESVTGQPYTIEDLRRSADRDYALRYAFNLKSGVSPGANRLPDRIVEQMMEKEARWESDWPLAIPAFYESRGFDERGYPNTETLHALDLDHVIQDVDLWKR